MNTCYFIPAPRPRHCALWDRSTLRQWAGGSDRKQGSPNDAAVGSGAQAIGHGRRILLIEDNRDYAEGLQVYLELFGYEVEVARTGTEGVEAALRRPPHVVICDIGLPGMDGFEVARTLRSSPITAKVRLLAVTGYGTDDDKRKSEEAGFDLHLVKPVEASRLLSLLDPAPPN